VRASRPRASAGLLWGLLALFVLRVVGQLLVALGLAPQLPPMDLWYSGLLPYRPLLVAQIAIVALYAKVALDFTRERGFFAAPHPRLGRALLVFGWLYAGAMAVRYLLVMALQPEARWTGGAIPIFFHWVLAAFLLTVGRHHARAPVPRPLLDAPPGAA
jgi:hypothetical protein